MEFSAPAELCYPAGEGILRTGNEPPSYALRRVAPKESTSMRPTTWNSVFVLCFAMAFAAACDTSSSTGGGADTGADITTDGVDEPDGGDAINGDLPPDPLDVAHPDADTGPDDTLVIDPLVATVTCSQICTDIVTNCPEAYDGDQADCANQCEAKVEEDGAWLGNFQCYMITCEETLCQMNDGPVAPYEDCEGVCDALDECDLLPAVDIPMDAPAACYAICAGSALVSPDIDEQIGCLLDASSNCSAEQAGMCIGNVPGPPPGEMCQFFCGGLLDPTSPDGFACGPASQLAEHYGDLAGCMETCTAFDAMSVWRWFGCVATGGCGVPTHCENPPDSDSQGCIDACDSIFDLCGKMGGIDNIAVCPPICTGISLNFGGEVNPDAGACVDAAEECPPDEDGENGLFMGCILEPSDECALICDSVTVCMGDEDTEFTADACADWCTMGGLGTKDEVAEMATCVDTAGFDCAAVFACLPEDEGKPDVDPALIGPSCASVCTDMVSTCGEDPVFGGDIGACVESCVPAAEWDVWWLASFVCYRDSCDPGLCGLVTETPLGPAAGCKEACGALDDCDFLGLVEIPQNQPGLCELSCAGGIVANPAQLALSLGCMEEATATCDEEATIACIEATADPTIASMCDDVCGALWDPIDDQYCLADSDIKAVWPDAGACWMDCVSQEPVTKALRFAGCIWGAGCGDTTHCLTPPDEDSAVCVEVCDALIEACPPAPEDEFDASVCGAVCTGILMNFEGSDPDALACVNAIESCGGEDDPYSDLFGQLLGCTLLKPQACQDICPTLAACSDPADPFNTEQCLQSCAVGFFDDEVLSTTAICVDAAGEDCAAAWACIEDVDPGAKMDVDPETLTGWCGELCTSLAEDCAEESLFDGDQAACLAACAADAAADPWWMANYTCYSESCDADLCLLGDDSGPIQPALGCFDACTWLEECDLLGNLVPVPNNQADLCYLECSGSVLSTPEEVQAGIQCLWNALGGGCDEEAALACLAPPDDEP